MSSNGSWCMVENFLRFEILTKFNCPLFLQKSTLLLEFYRGFHFVVFDSVFIYLVKNRFFKSNNEHLERSIPSFGTVPYNSFRASDG